jgi:hypothetical protein
VTTSNINIHDVSELRTFLDRQGGLHDCVIESLRWEPAKDYLEMTFPDVNANFLGLPDYTGRLACVLKLSGIKDVLFDVTNFDGRLKVYDARVSTADPHSRLEIGFSPSGRLSVSFADLRLVEVR